MEKHSHIHGVSLIFFFDKDGTFLHYVKVDEDLNEVIEISTLIGKSLKETIPFFGDKATELVKETLSTKTGIVHTKSVLGVKCKATLLPMPCGNVCALVSLD